MSKPQGRNLGLRLDAATTIDLDNFEKGSGIEATTLARNALCACLAYWKQHGRISFPLKLVESTAEEHTTQRFSHILNEEPAPFKTRK